MFQFRMLGALDLRGSDGPEAASLLVQPRRLALLAYLASAQPHGFHRRDHLLALFWPELDQPRARAALSQALHVLRRALGPGVLLTRGNEEVGLDRTRIITDAEQFEQAADAGALQDADRLYRGDLLPGFHLAESPEFERWLEATRSRLRDRAAAIARTQAAAAADRGDHAVGAEWLRRLRELAPLDESALRQLMQFHISTGDRAAALLAYEEFAALLRQELEVEPSPATVAVMDQIRAASTALPPRPSPRAALSRVEVAALETPPTRTATEPAPPPPSHRRARMAFAVVVLLLLAAVAPVLLLRRASSGPSVERVAVLPFVVRGDSSLAYLREGLVDLLSTKLDALGAFQAVDPAIVLAATMEVPGDVQSEALPDSGASIARRVGAELFIIGRVVRVAGAVELSASLFDSRGRRQALVTALADSGTTLPVAVDQLVRNLVATRWSAPADRLQRLAVTSTASPEALRAYLEGERAFRAGEYSRARDAFLAAVTADSLYALAHYRLSVAAGWVADDTNYRAAAHRALALSNRLTEHDRLLVNAHVAYLERSADEAEQLYRGILRLYPEDAEAWYNLGEVLFHANPLRGRPLAAAQEAFERTEALTGHSTEALSHLYSIRLLTGDLKAAAALQRTLLDHYPAHEPRRQLYAMMDAAVRRDSAAEAALLEGATRTAGGELYILARVLAVYTDRLDLADSIAGLMRNPARPLADRVVGHALRVEFMMARGTWRAAHGEAERLRHLDRATGDEVLAAMATLPWVGATAEEYREARQQLGRWLPRPDPPRAGIQPLPTAQLRDQLQLFYEAICALALGDTGAVTQVTQRMGRVNAPLERRSPTGLRLIARAAVALSRGDPTRALTLLDSIPPTGIMAPDLLQYSHAYERLLRGEALASLGRHEEALGWFRSFHVIFGFDLPYRGPALYREAESLEALGRREEARGTYQRFLGLYADSDARFEPLLRRARERVAEGGR